MTWEKFENPPIIEAVFSVILENEISLSYLEQFKETSLIKEKYPNQDSQLSQAHTGNGKIFSITIFSSKSKKRRIATYLNSIQFHLLSDYKGWEDAVSDFSDIIVEFFNVIPDNEIKQISVRKLNRIKLDVDISVTTTFEISDYTHVYPNTPKGSSTENYADFDISLTIINDNMMGKLNETIHIEDGNVFLEIDINTLKNLNKRTTEIKIFDDFSFLRPFKNKIFFDTITDRTKNILKTNL